MTTAHPPLTLSVVIPCYNYEAFLAPAIESMLANSRPPDEIIVVDDGSRDASAEVALRYPQVRLVQKTNGGMASALNAGAAAATGDVLVLLDADDLADPGRIEWIERAFAGSDVCMAWHPLRIVTLDSGYRGTLPDVPLPAGDLIPGILARGLTAFAVTSGIAVRRSAFDAVGPIPEDDFRAAAESYLVRTLPFIGRVVACDEPLGTYRSHGGSDSRALPRIDRESTVAKLSRQIEAAANEHQLLSTSAERAGHAFPVARVRGLDPVYLAYVRLHARLAGQSRRSAWRDLRTLPVDVPRRLTHRRVWMFISAGWFVLMPRTVAMAVYAIRGDHELNGLLRQLARFYWLQRSARSGIVGRLARLMP